MAESRYKSVKSKRKEVTSKHRKKMSPEHNETVYYEAIPEQNSDMYYLAQEGDRLDLLAHRFYGDASLWWYIARANNLTSMNIPAGTQFRVPASTRFAKVKKNKGNIY